MPLAVPLLKEALEEPGAPAALRASIHQRLSLYVRFVEGLDAAEQHALAAVKLADELGDDCTSRLGSRRAGADPLQRGEAGSARARRPRVRARRRSGGPAADGRRRLRARPHPRLVGSLRRAPAVCSSGSTATGASGTSAWPRTRSGTSRWSSSAPATSRSPASTPRPRAASARSTCATRRSRHRVSSRRRSSRRTAATSPARGSSPCGSASSPISTPRGSRRRSACSVWSSSGPATPKLPSRVSPPQRRSAMQPTAPSRRCPGGAQSRSRRCSSSASSTTPSSGSTRGTRLHAGSSASGRSRT